MGGYFNNNYDNNDYDANAPRNAITAAPAERSSLRPGPCFLRNASICSVGQNSQDADLVADSF
jgi:hypothetical protein